MSVLFVTIVKMNVKSYIILFVCVIPGLQNVLATIPEVKLITDDGVKKCTRKYKFVTKLSSFLLTALWHILVLKPQLYQTTCSVSFDGKKIMERGEKGEVGTPGMPGLTGPKGDVGEKGETGPQGPSGPKGERGEPGFNGIPGSPGAKGVAGENGTMGPQGPSGPKGEKGESGSNGMPGTPGLKGDRGANGETGPAGPMGLAGPTGPPGIPGRPGVCPCFNAPNTFDPRETNIAFGTYDVPAQDPCKSAPPGLKSGTYYLGPELKSMEVYCNMSSLETCIRINKKTPECNYDTSKGPIWLNEMNVHMKELYYNISVEQLTWLRDRSESVRQTLKYNCLDSVPYSKRNMSASVKLWAWNDVVIGPYPTDQSPIFYHVPPATDKCEEGSTEWKSTIIELQSSNVYRLPIVDLWIGDIRNKNQRMSIESVELCFG